MSQIINSKLAFENLKPHFNYYSEEFWLITLDNHLQITKLKMISKGTLNLCPVHPRDLFREALFANAFAMIIGHNHPSHQIIPTENDIVITKKLIKISKLIEIPIIDHIIFSSKNYFSFKENQLLFY